MRICLYEKPDMSGHQDILLASVYNIITLGEEAKVLNMQSQSCLPENGDRSNG